MDSFDAIREKAVAFRMNLQEEVSGLSAPLLVRKICAREGLEIIQLKEDDALLHRAEAVLDREMAAIYFKQGTPPDEAAALIAHELGHLELHANSASCEADELDVSSPDEAKLANAASVEGYGSRERQELQANVFGREMLLPRSQARSLFLDERLRAWEMGERLEIPMDIVYQQLCDALLVPLFEEPSKQDQTEKPGLNASQAEAAHHQGSPLLLEAGPGTGKTRTLVARIVHLVENGADPGSILALTFSNKAAQELSERVAAELPQGAAAIWTGTFHAFGLEILRKYYHFFGLEPDLRMFSRTDAIELLEERLPTLGLKHHQNLYEPALELKEMLSAISRAKDELVDAAGYLELAQDMVEQAETEETSLAGERAMEVASVYKIYEKLLAEKKVVDFGDLIMKPCLLLERQPAVRAAVCLRHRHVLVDEYQDVNRASARLMRAIADDGNRLWVVGDSRQSIYRFRGASSANMALFGGDFPNAKRKALEVNYRSSAEIVTQFSGFSASMRASRAALSLELVAQRGASKVEPDLSDLPDLAGQLSAVSARVQHLYRQGVPYREQAILCRSNKTLNLFAAALEERNIPVLYFGSLFEREEVRDMLALLSLLTDKAGGGLMRVAHFQDYQIPLNDVSLFLRQVRKKEVMAIEALAELAHYKQGMSTQGQQGMSRLAKDLHGLKRHKAPWTLLVTYLFEKSEYLWRLLSSDIISDRMCCLALYQFLNFVRGQKGGKGQSPTRRLLQKVRMLMLLGEERHWSQIPSAALGLDAVRLMTIHGSKGLEFEAVHLPSMMATSFPMNYRPNRCPPPTGLLTLVEGMDEEEPDKELHEEEEECLFYVALSRAKTHLHLYRARSSGNRNRSPSKFLARMRPALIKVLVPDLLQAETMIQLAPTIPTSEPPPEETSAALLMEYERCPRRYFYARVFGLAGSRKQSAFVKTHRCIYEVIDWVKRQEPGSTIEMAEVKQQLDLSWKEAGPQGHGFEDRYRKLADSIVSNLVLSQANLKTAKAEPVTIQLTHGKVVLEPDQVVATEQGGKVLRMIKTGRKGSFKGEDTIHALYQLGADQDRGPRETTVEVVHLTDQQTTEVRMTGRKCNTRVNKADGYLAEIKKGRYPSSQDSVSCPRCPYFFVCPTVPKGTLCQRRDREQPEEE